MLWCAVGLADIIEHILKLKLSNNNNKCSVLDHRTLNIFTALDFVITTGNY